MLNQETKDLNPENFKWMNRSDANKLAAKYVEQKRKQKFNNTYIPFDQYKDLHSRKLTNYRKH